MHVPRDYFHGGNTGSNPVGDAKSYQQLGGTATVFRRHKKAQTHASVADTVARTRNRYSRIVGYTTTAVDMPKLMIEMFHISSQ